MPTPNPEIPNIPNTPEVGRPLSISHAQPIVLFAVKLETRLFPQADGSSELRVRVYPDKIHIDSHEPELTADEIVWGQHFWEQTWRAGNDEERAKAAWRQLADRFDPPRAAWIARALKPLNPDDRPKAPIAPDEPLLHPIRFPSPAAKDEAWTRAAYTRVLPSQWFVLGYQAGRLVVNVQGGSIPPSLATGPDPSKSAKVDQAGIDEGMKWIVDFDEAEKVGMGIRAKLTKEVAAAGLDFLLVLGVKDLPDGTTDGTSRLVELFDAHHYTDGLSFVAQGTPTNNTPDAPSGFSSQDLGHEESYLAERAAPPFEPGDGSNAGVLITALGLENAGPVFANLPHAAEKEQVDARQMNTALWQATWGYFLLQMLGVGGTPDESPLTDGDIAWARSHFIEYVRASGPLPAVRVGKQPYGILPVTSLNAWKPQPDQASQSARDSSLRNFLIQLRDLWRRNYPDVPRLGRSENDQENSLDTDLAEVLSMDGLSTNYSMRDLLGRHYLEHLWVFMAADFISKPHSTPVNLTQIPGLFSAWFVKQDELAGAVLQTLGIKQRPRLAHAVFLPPVAPLGGALVQVDHSLLLSPNYIESLLAARDLSAIDKGTIEPPPPHTLLYLLLRHSMLLEYAAAASRLLKVEPNLRREPELVNLKQGQVTQTVWEQLKTEIDVAGVKMPAGRYLLDFTPSGEPDVARVPDLKSLSEFRASLAHLKSLDVNRLEQLLTGTLDLCSHRLDAWITSFATKRLTAMRKAKPTGVLIGGYGWVMNLKPADAKTEVEPPPGEQAPIFELANNPGFVHTPSLTQAATAAVLRSGHLAHSGSQSPNNLLAIDLSSERVRLASWLLDGVRQGQPLAALLGYRFERGLHDHGLDRFIALFRRIAPFGELLKAEDAMRKAQDGVTKLQNELTSAEAARDAARQRHQQLLAEQAGLPGKITQADSRVQQIRDELQNVENQISILANQIDRNNKAHPPKDNTKLETQLEAALTRKNVLNGNLVAAQATAQQLRGRVTTIPGEIAAALNAVQQAERRVVELSDQLTTAELAAKAAEARYQELLDQHRRNFHLPGSADQGALEAIAANDVADGLELQRRWQAAKSVNSGNPLAALFDPLKNRLSPTGFTNLMTDLTREKRPLETELDRLVDSVDAVSDALLAESVYQSVRGNPLRAASTVESIAGGETPPPELEVARTPRTGIALTHRLITLFSGEPHLPPAWAPPPNPLRANADPHLNAWAANLLGNPAKVCCVVERLEPNTGEVLESKEIRLSELRLAPLDFIYAVEGGQGGQQAEIEQRILYRIMRKPDGFPPGSLLRINPGRAAGWKPDELSYGEFSELLRAARKLLTGARGIDADDLIPPERSANFSVDVVDLEKRAASAEQSLLQSRNAIHAQLAHPDTANLDALRESIVRSASFGIAGAVPLSAAGTSPADRQTLLTQAGSIERELTQRITQLTSLAAGFDASRATAESKRDHALARLRIVFGKAFVILPRFQAANADELAKALADSTPLQDGDPLAAVTWFQRMARIRDGVARLNQALTYAEALGSGERLKLTVAQLPYSANDRWVGLPLNEGKSLPGGKLSLVVQSIIPVDATQSLAGLLIDEWVEVVPSATETTAIAFQYDQPNSAPPQSILIAVPPEMDAPWTVWSLQQVLLETLDLARIRAVDPDALDEVGHYLPALYFAFNTDGDTVSTDFTPIK